MSEDRYADHWRVEESFDIPAVEMPRFVDTHVHFFDVEDTRGSKWSWTDLSSLPPDDGTFRTRGHGIQLTRDLGALGLKRFTPPELWLSGTRLARISKVVHVQAGLNPDPVRETSWLAELNERYGAPHAAIARVALETPDAEEVLQAHLEFDIVRGVRDPGKTRVMLDPAYQEGVKRLGELGLILEVHCTHRRFSDLAAMARGCSDTTIVLEHFGIPPLRSDEEFAVWHQRLVQLAACENVWLKLSGIAISNAEWTFADAQALVLAGVEAFGPSRCVVGSNWPVDLPSGAYPDAILATAAALAAYSPDERAAIFAANAEKLYRI